MLRSEFTASVFIFVSLSELKFIGDALRVCRLSASPFPPSYIGEIFNKTNCIRLVFISLIIFYF